MRLGHGYLHDRSAMKRNESHISHEDIHCMILHVLTSALCDHHHLGNVSAPCAVHHRISVPSNLTRPC